MPVSAVSPIIRRTVFFSSFLPPDTILHRRVLLPRARSASVVFASGVWPGSGLWTPKGKGRVGLPAQLTKSRDGGRECVLPLARPWHARYARKEYGRRCGAC